MENVDKIQLCRDIINKFYVYHFEKHYNEFPNDLIKTLQGSIDYIKQYLEQNKAVENYDELQKSISDGEMVLNRITPLIIYHFEDGEIKQIEL